MMGRRWAPWLLVLFLVSCGADGGTSGTGITGGTSGTGVNSETIDTAIEGNVSSAQGGLGGLRVAVDRTSSEGWTDGDGYFSFAGSFGEEVTVLFERDGRQAALGATVPSGGVLTLQDVTADLDSGAARVGRQGVRFEAIVRNLRCLEEVIEVASRFAPDGPLYTVYTDGARIETRGGQPATCQQLRPGDEVHVQGSISPDGTVGGEGSRSEQNVTGFDLP